MRTLSTILTSRSLASDLYEEMERTLSPYVYDERSFAPACDVTEAESHYLMSVDLPGMKKDEIKIELNENVLVISGERKRINGATDEGRLQRFEKSYGFFKRSFSLPRSIEGEKVEARYEDGVLEIYLPKTHSARPRHIEIQTDRSGIFSKLLNGKKAELKDVKIS